MNQNATIAVMAIIGLMVLASITARRELLGQRLRYLVAIGAVGGITFAFAQKMTDQSHAVLYAIGAGLLAGFAARPRHSRYIRARDRRRVIAEFERRGEKYNPKKHEIDHEVPWSRGGGNTADNLKVVSKAKNRAKSNRSPWWDVFR